jgi:hypothetical protein
MRNLLAALSVLALLTACQRRDTETGAQRDREGTDTAVTSTSVKDTTVVKADTNIDVDTTKKTEHGKEARQ